MFKFTLNNFIMKSSSKGIILGCVIAAFFAVVSYLGAERAMLGKMRSDIEASVGQDYAILALHMGGNDFERPSLWEMLKLVFLYETNLTGEYSPQGSGGYTGKKHYLALLISDNNEITFCEWSFRIGGWYSTKKRRCHGMLSSIFLKPISHCTATMMLNWKSVAD